MSNEIVRRLMRNNQKNTNYLKESMLLYEEEEDTEEDLPLEDEEEMPGEDITDIPDEEYDDSGYPGIDKPKITRKGPSFDDEGEDTPPEEEEEISPDELADMPVETEERKNPLDNNYAVDYKLGQKVSLTYSNGTKSKLSGTIEGYDKEGFYRVKWANGMTTNGITDIALADFIEDISESRCVCGSTKFVNEGKSLVCDICGRSIRESNDPLAIADKSRPKGKKLIRSEAHPVSTAIKPSINENNDDSGYAISHTYDGDELSDYRTTVIVKARSEEDAIRTAKKNIPDGRHFEVDTTIGEKGRVPSVKDWKSKNPKSNYDIYECDYSIKDSIFRAFSTSIRESEDTSVFGKLKKELDRVFWSRTSEMIDDIEKLGYEVLESDAEYVIIGTEDSEGDEYVLKVPIIGTSRTIALDFAKSREL